MINISMQQLGVVVSEVKTLKDDCWGNSICSIQVDCSIPADALEGIAEFSHVDIYFYMHLVDKQKIVVEARHPRNNPELPKVGIFSQRAKNRLNQLGHTTVELIKVDLEIKTLTVRGLDAVDGTPVLDIKPYIKQFAPRQNTKQPEWADHIMKDYFNCDNGV